MVIYGTRKTYLLLLFREKQMENSTRHYVLTQSYYFAKKQVH